MRHTHILLTLLTLPLYVLSGCQTLEPLDQIAPLKVSDIALTNEVIAAQDYSIEQNLGGLLFAHSTPDNAGRFGVRIKNVADLAQSNSDGTKQSLRIYQTQSVCKTYSKDGAFYGAGVMLWDQKAPSKYAKSYNERSKTMYVSAFCISADFEAITKKPNT